MFKHLALITALVSFLNIIPLPGATPALAAAQPAGTNLIANPNVNTPVASSRPIVPVDWQNGSWGTNNAVFSYTVPTRYVPQQRSLLTTITNYTDGDAKWYFKPVAIDGGSYYTYADSYKSSVVTHIVAQIEDANGNISYSYLGQAPSTLNWKPISFTFPTPATAKNLTVFHLLASQGALYTDDFSLVKREAIQITDGVPNASVEQSALDGTNAPGEWYPGGWGSNTRTLTWANEGHTGTHSVKAEVSNYTDGDAKWFYTPQAITPNQTYTISDWYKSNVDTHVNAVIERTGGQMQYLTLKDAPTAAGWTQYSDSFTAPFDAKSLTIFHVINANGFVQTDDYSVKPRQVVGFNQGLVSISLDDGWASQYNLAFPLLQQSGMKATYYVTTGLLGQASYFSQSDVTTLAQAGEQIADHTITHPHLTQITASEVEHEIHDSQITLQGLSHQTVNDIASPYGETNIPVLNQIKQYYGSHRGIETGYNSKDNFDVYDLRVQSVVSTTTLAEIQSWIDTAMRDKTWLILVYHQVDNSGSEFATTPAAFTQQLQAIQAKGIKTATVGEALAEIKAQ